MLKSYAYHIESKPPIDTKKLYRGYFKLNQIGIFYFIDILKKDGNMDIGYLTLFPVDSL